jgi:hypothetical protein
VTLRQEFRGSRFKCDDDFTDLAISSAEIADDGHLFFPTQPQHTAAIVERFLGSD